MALRAVGWFVGVALLAAGAACGDGKDPKAEAGQPTVTTVEAVTTTARPAVKTAAPTATTAPAGCLTVSSASAGRLNVPAASAVRGTVPTKPSGLARRGVVWFVSTRAGATWVTNADPTADETGLVLPLNDKARAASQLGVDVPAGSPVYEGLTDSSPGAVRSRTCAGA